MRIASILFCVGAMFCLTDAALAQRTMDKTEIQNILNQLTSQSRKTWISAGTIEATHQIYGAPKITDSTRIKAKIDEAIRQYEQDTDKKELTPEWQKKKLDAIPFNVKYKLANEYSMSSREVVKYDGQRFHWEITVNSRTDSVKPDATLAENALTEEFDLAGNQKRIFTWDGQKYTIYATSKGKAFVDAAGRLPRGVNGPLTAGLIPWGNGKFSSASLSAASVSALETSTKTVRMTITHSDGSTTEVTLDPSKAYAVTSATLTKADDFSVTFTYSGYKSFAGQWVPSSVAIERKNDSIDGQAPTSEQWTITSVNTATPSLSSFNVLVAMDAMVEYMSPAMVSSALYINSYEVDTDELLAQRLAYGMAEGLRPQNCATVAVQHVASGFGKSVSVAALANLVGPDGSTSLYDLKQFAQSLGLYGRVVKTDLAALENLGSAKAILHIPGKNHFVVLDRVDDQYVWLVDLSDKRFYRRQSVHFFPLEWTAGTALLLSDRPLSGQFAEIPDTMLKDMTGGWYAACTMKVQDFDQFGCIILSGLCQGAYTILFERWGCQSAVSGTCSEYEDVFRMQTPCIPDPIYDCDLLMDWYCYYEDVCK